MMSILSTRHVLFLYTCLKVWHHACARTDASSGGGAEITTTDSADTTSSSIIGSPYACAQCCEGKNDMCSGLFYVTRCYCDEACIGYGDCCYNYIPLCGNPADAERDDVWCSSLGVCCHGQNNWCAGTVAGLTCYCDEACDGLGDCCEDYKFYCQGYMSDLWFDDASRWTAPTQDTAHTTAMPPNAPTTTVGESDASATDGNSEGSDGNSEGTDGNSEGSDGNSEVSDGNSEDSDGNSEGSDGNSEGSDGNSEVSDGNSEVSDGSSEGSDGNSEGSDNDMQESICNRDVTCCESLDIALCEGVSADRTSCYCDPSCDLFHDCCVGLENCMFTDVIEE